LTSEGAADIRVGGMPIEMTPHNCFGCGTLNAAGLQMPLHSAADQCWVELELPERFEGWEGIAHGGILCTILDEVMAWAVVDRDLWGVTARMSVEFRKPVSIGMPIRAEGRVTAARRRVVETEGVILDRRDGTVLARAEATFVGASDARKAELKARYGFRIAPGDINTPGPVDVTGQETDGGRV
jgi:uncharacterized protein (TIGR00369 family)